MNKNTLPGLFLGSQSPRREQLLLSLGLSFSVLKPKAREEEEATDETIDKVTLENSLRKANSVVKDLPDSSGVIIGADTLVVLDGVALTKPIDRADGVRILKKLSSRTHRVVTGLTLLSPEFGCRQSVENSSVTFRGLSDREIEAYLDTREPYDKAGAYAVQGLGSLFIDQIEGSYTNVMGLPIELMIEELALLTRTTVYDWFKA